MSSRALALMARAAEGSMRDAQSAFDQVIAFAGQTITVDDVSTVLGLVGRDLLFDLIEAVSRRTARGRSRWRIAPSSRATTCGSCAASSRAWCAT